jgi:hypothetical protein
MRSLHGGPDEILCAQVSPVKVVAECAELPPRVVTMTTTPPLKAKPEVGRDVAIVPAGDGNAAKPIYRIEWGAAPQ